PTQTYEWVGGADVSVVPTGLRSAHVEKRSSEFEALQLIGTEVTIQVTALAEQHRSDAGNFSIPIVAEPFVRVVHRTDSPIAQERNAIDVQVFLVNDTDCAVSDVTYDEDLGGLVAIEGSGRFNGELNGSLVGTGTLRFTHLSLPAHDRAQLTYAARLPLF